MDGSGSVVVRAIAYHTPKGDILSKQLAVLDPATAIATDTATTVVRRRKASRLQEENGLGLAETEAFTPYPNFEAFWAKESRYVRNFLRSRRCPKDLLDDF